MVHSSPTMKRVCCTTLAMAVDLEMLHVGESVPFKLRGSLNTERAVLPQVRRVAAIPEEATARATHLFKRTLTKEGW